MNVIDKNNKKPTNRSYPPNYYTLELDALYLTQKEKEQLRVLVAKERNAATKAEVVPDRSITVTTNQGGKQERVFKGEFTTPPTFVGSVTVGASVLTEQNSSHEIKEEKKYGHDTVEQQVAQIREDYLLKILLARGKEINRVDPDTTQPQYNHWYHQQKLIISAQANAVEHSKEKLSEVFWENKPDFGRFAYRLQVFFSDRETQENAAVTDALLEEAKKKQRYHST